MADPGSTGPGTPTVRGPGGRTLRVAHLTTVDMSLSLLLGAELGVDVDAGLEVYGISAPGRFVPDIRDRGVTHVPVASLTRSWSPRQDTAAVGELAGVLRHLRLDVLHTHNPKTGVLGRLLGRALRIPVVVNTCHGLWTQPGDPWMRRGLVLGVESLAAVASHYELYQNGVDQQTLRRVVPARRSRVVGNGIDLQRFTPTPAGRARVRAGLGVHDEDLLVGGVGRKVAEKGIHEFVSAARALAGKARFVWVGPDDPDKPDALSGAADVVEFLGERRDMPDIYSALDVFVLPSYREGFSRSGMEAAACATPSVLTDIRGCRDVGRHERELLLVPPGDGVALEAALHRLLTDPALRSRLGTAARRYALARFDQRAVARTSLETYVTVARRKGLDWTIEES